MLITQHNLQFMESQSPGIHVIKQNRTSEKEIFESSSQYPAFKYLILKTLFRNLSTFLKVHYKNAVSRNLEFEKKKPSVILESNENTTCFQHKVHQPWQRWFGRWTVPLQLCRVSHQLQEAQVPQELLFQLSVSMHRLPSVRFYSILTLPVRENIRKQ